MAGALYFVAAIIFALSEKKGGSLPIRDQLLKCDSVIIMQIKDHSLPVAHVERAHHETDRRL
jgi:hypothetical protein